MADAWLPSSTHAKAQKRDSLDFGQPKESSRLSTTPFYEIISAAGTYPCLHCRIRTPLGVLERGKADLELDHDNTHRICRLNGHRAVATFLPINFATRSQIYAETYTSREIGWQPEGPSGNEGPHWDGIHDSGVGIDDKGEHEVEHGELQFSGEELARRSNKETAKALAALEGRHDSSDACPTYDYPRLSFEHDKSEWMGKPLEKEPL